MYSAAVFGLGVLTGALVYFLCVHKPAVAKLQTEMNLLYRFVRDNTK